MSAASYAGPVSDAADGGSGTARDNAELLRCIINCDMGLLVEHVGDQEYKMGRARAQKNAQPLRVAPSFHQRRRFWRIYADT